MPQQLMFRIPYDSNLRYLPLMYFLPEDIIIKFPTLRSLPRCLGEIARSEKLIDLINCDNFLNEIADAAASMVFPHFGFGGWKEHYTGYSPIWQLSYALPLWAKLLEEDNDWGLQRLFQIKSTKSIPFFDPDYIKAVMSKIVKRVIEENNWQPIFEVVREMPCDEDFMNWHTNVRKDFLRKWYHTRSKKVQMVSLDACLEDEQNGIYEIEDKSANFEDKIIAEDFCNRFKARLSEKDMKILELRVEGFTYEEIADELGYKNHSGIIKRIQAITKEFTKYEEEQR